jgi:hypothetical protein
MLCKFVFSFLLILTGTVISFGQGQSLSKSCKVGSDLFVCPKASRILSDGRDGSVFVANRSGIGLFAMQLKENSTADEALPLALDSSLRKLYSARYADYQAKNSDDFWGNNKYSKFEESKSGIVLFNPTLRQFLHVHFVVLAFDGKRVLTGFTDLWAKGAEAAASFNEWQGGGGAGDEELQDLILSITKEGRPKEVPGGPPPAMAPPKKP